MASNLTPDNKTRTDSPFYESEQFTRHLHQVVMVNAIYDGSDTAVKYLEPFIREDAKALDYRKKVMTLNNFVKRTVTSSRNKIFRKAPTIEGNISEEEQENLIQFSMDATDLVIKDGFCFSVVDTPVKTIEGPITKANDTKPYMYLVLRANVPNYTSYIQDNKEIFTHVTINELYAESSGLYGTVYGSQQRVYVLKEGKVEIEIWRKGEQMTELTVMTDFTEIPIVKIGKADIPYLYDMAKVNVSHMNRRSELNRYLRIAATPIPVLYGTLNADGSGTEVTIGVDQSLQFKRKDEGGFEWAELTGTSTDLLQDDLKKMELDMIDMALTLTAKDESNQVKTAAQVNDDASEGESRLANIADETEYGINRSLEYLAIANGYTAKIMLNKDYDSNVLTPERIDKIVTLYREGLIDIDTAWKILIDGEVLPDDFDTEKAKTGLLTE